MDSKKTKVAILFGGRSTEHQISLISAQNVYNSLDKNKYEAVLIGIDKSGKWHLKNAFNLLNQENPNTIALDSSLDNPILLSQNTNDKRLFSIKTKDAISGIDVIFPVLHGTYGEDGSVQGLAKLANLPCVGCGILGSSVGMDKDIMKHVLRSVGISVAKWVTVRNTNAQSFPYAKVKELLGSELFIKPANLGSSVGVSFANSEETYNQALTEALKYDHKVIVEEKIIGREIECAVLGNQDPRASVPGEIVPKDGFYSFENKYLDEKGATLHIPADLDEATVAKVKALSLHTYISLECRGMSRVDMFLTPSGELIINEINTIPGFTNISMYPKLWEFSGLSQQDLISELINLAIQEHDDQNKLVL